MSVIIAARFTGDTQKFTTSLSERAPMYREIAERAKANGALHHRFAVGEGFVLINDEWETPEAFQSFFSDPDLQNFIASVGGDMSTAPEVTIATSIDSPDEF